MALILAPGFIQAQERIDQAINSYLLQDCYENPQDLTGSLVAIKANKKQYVGQLLHVLEHGPDETSEAKFMARMKRLSRNGDKEIWDGITERALRNFRNGIKNRALVAIVHIDDPQTATQLRTILQKSEDPPFMKRMIEEAIKKLQTE
ncbi:MAG: hypothetical protein R8G66_08970 [Cytophagales bacterium]|nr:hypothetical protein [Cytophagales bacterium]